MIWFWLNPPQHTLTWKVVLKGKNIDPFSGWLCSTDSFFTIQPTTRSGISFCIKDSVIPYDDDHMEAIDSPLWRMLCIKDESSDTKIMLVEHLLSAIQLLWLTNIEIVLNDSSYWPLTSTKVPLFWFWHPTYWIPVMWPWVSGFVQQILPHCRETNKTSEIITVNKKAVYQITDLDPRYNGIERMMSIEPADKLITKIISAVQPDILNNPEAQPFTIAEWENITPYLNARPIMRLGSTAPNPITRLLSSKWKEIFLWLLNLRSYALTRDTYFRSRNGMTKEDVVKRMHIQFRENQNEHLVHTAIADFPAELWAFLRWRHLHACITLADTTHVFRMAALKQLLTNEILWR